MTWTSEQGRGRHLHDHHYLQQMGPLKLLQAACRPSYALHSALIKLVESAVRGRTQRRHKLAGVALAGGEEGAALQRGVRREECLQPGVQAHGGLQHRARRAAASCGRDQDTEAGPLRNQAAGLSLALRQMRSVALYTPAALAR